MRVISQDYSVDTDYENSTFRIVPPETEDGKYIIESIPFDLEFGKYFTFEEAQDAMKQMHLKYSTVFITNNDSHLVFTDKSTYDQLIKDKPMANLINIQDIPNKVFVFPKAKIQ